MSVLAGGINGDIADLINGVSVDNTDNAVIEKYVLNNHVPAYTGNLKTGQYLVLRPTYGSEIYYEVKDMPLNTMYLNELTITDNNGAELPSDNPLANRSNVKVNVNGVYRGIGTIPLVIAQYSADGKLIGSVIDEVTLTDADSISAISISKSFTINNSYEDGYVKAYLFDSGDLIPLLPSVSTTK